MIWAALIELGILAMIVGLVVWALRGKPKP